MSDSKFLLHILIIFLEFLEMPKRGFGIDSWHPFLESPNSQSIKRGPLSWTSHDQFSYRFFIYRAFSPPPLFLLQISNHFKVSKVFVEEERVQLSKLFANQHLRAPDLRQSLSEFIHRGQTTLCGYEGSEKHPLQPLDQRGLRSKFIW